MDSRTSTKHARYYTAYISSFNNQHLHLRNPWVPAWWSAAFPGFGHLMLGQYIKGVVYFIWEFVINVNAQLNLAIIYSFQGQFELASQVLNTKWLLFYIPVYIGTIWDSYRTSVEQNKLYVLAQHESAPIVKYHMSAIGINYLDKRNPWFAVVASAFTPGLGQLYGARFFQGFFLVISWILISYMSNLLDGIHLTFIGDFNQAIATLDPQWFLFLPSIYCWSMFDAYVQTVEYNKLFKIEQAKFLSDSYQNGSLKLNTQMNKSW